MFTECWLPGLHWLASSTPNISWCPVHCNRDKVTHLCNLLSHSHLYPVHASTSALVILPLHVTPTIFHKFRCWNTSSFFSIFLLLFHVSLAYKAVAKTTAAHNCCSVFTPSAADFGTLLSLLKTVAASAGWVFTSISASPSFAISPLR